MIVDILSKISVVLWLAKRITIFQGYSLVIIFLHYLKSLFQIEIVPHVYVGML